MKIYIAGKITGDKHYKKKFRKAEKKLAKLGHSVMNPANLGNYPGFFWEDYMKTSRAMQDVCEAVLFLPDWKTAGVRLRNGNMRESWGRESSLTLRKCLKTGVNDRKMKLGRHKAVFFLCLDIFSLFRFKVFFFLPYIFFRTVRNRSFLPRTRRFYFYSLQEQRHGNNTKHRRSAFS